MNLHRQFARHFEPKRAFENFCTQTWNQFDVNHDGKISFDEFVTVFNSILDR